MTKFSQSIQLKTYNPRPMVQAPANGKIVNCQIVKYTYASPFYPFRRFFADPRVSNTGMFFNLSVYLSLCLDGGIFGHGGGSPYAQHSHAHVYHFRHPLRKPYTDGCLSQAHAP